MLQRRVGRLGNIIFELAAAADLQHGARDLIVITKQIVFDQVHIGRSAPYNLL
ncbi:hypothetical protein D3C76_1831650 [compost metagenome]